MLQILTGWQLTLSFYYRIGGASVVYTDTISDLGVASEVANYGEYSGDPTEALTHQYARTIFSLMTKGEPHPKGKVSIHLVSATEANKDFRF